MNSNMSNSSFFDPPLLTVTEIQRTSPSVIKVIEPPKKVENDSSPDNSNPISLANPRHLSAGFTLGTGPSKSNSPPQLCDRYA